MRGHPCRPGVRFLAYGLTGWTLDSLFVWAHTGRRRPSGLLNLPVYGLAQTLFEPVHNLIRRRPLVFRAAVYGVGVLGVEYAYGRLLRRFVGRVPWDYGGARFGIDGLVRLDYLPLWAAYGLGLERFHDLLMRGQESSKAPARMIETDSRLTRRSGQGCAVFLRRLPEDAVECTPVEGRPSWRGRCRR